MTARPAGAHRRTPAAAPVIGEVRRIRGELARVTAERDQLADDNAELAAALAELRQIIATPDPMQDVEHWRSLFREAHRGDVDAAYWRGRGDEARERDALWHAAADPIARPGPSQSQLEVLRWGELGRARFADPRPGDYQGGPVACAEPADQAMAS